MAVFVPGTSTEERRPIGKTELVCDGKQLRTWKKTLITCHSRQADMLPQKESQVMTFVKKAITAGVEAPRPLFCVAKRLDWVRVAASSAVRLGQRSGAWTRFNSTEGDSQVGPHGKRRPVSKVQFDPLELSTSTSHLWAAEE